MCRYPPTLWVSLSTCRFDSTPGEPEMFKEYNSVRALKTPIKLAAVMLTSPATLEQVGIVQRNGHGVHVLE
jgi:hypothetical protein